MERRFLNGLALSGEFSSLFAHVTSKKDDHSKVKIEFNEKIYEGWLTVCKTGKINPAYRLWFDDPLCLELKHIFLMTTCAHWRHVLAL